MNKRDHNEFCAEINRRKKQLIQKKKRRQRVLLTCIPCLLCIGILAFAGLDRLSGGPETDSSISYSSESMDFIQAMLADPRGVITVQLPADGREEAEVLQFTSAEDLSALLGFVSTNADAFSLSYSSLTSQVGQTPGDTAASNGQSGWSSTQSDEADEMPETGRESFDIVTDSRETEPETEEKLPADAPPVENQTADLSYAQEEQTAEMTEEMTEAVSRAETEVAAVENTAYKEAEETEQIYENPADTQEECEMTAEVSAASPVYDCEATPITDGKITHIYPNTKDLYVIRIVSADGKNSIEISLDTSEYRQLSASLRRLLDQMKGEN